jgi:hypothetical protein
MFKKIAILGMYVSILVVFAGCASSKPKAESWTLPKKDAADSAMLIGYIGYPNNKKENSDGNILYLSEVNFMTKGKVYFGNGEKNIELDNNYFVVANLKPGKYWLNSFRTGELFDQLPLYDDKYFVEVKAGQVKFFGSYEFLEYDSSFLGAHSYKFEIRKATQPSELEMFEWLSRVGSGSGWEPAIKRRIHELGGKP